jgi:hypothetical protein
VFENRVLKMTFGPKRDEVTADWRIVHKHELHDLYFSPHIVQIKTKVTVAACGTYGEDVHTGFWGRRVRRGNLFKGLGV